MISLLYWLLVYDWSRLPNDYKTVHHHHSNDAYCHWKKMWDCQNHIHNFEMSEFRRLLGDYNKKYIYSNYWYQEHRSNYYTYMYSEWLGLQGLRMHYKLLLLNYYKYKYWLSSKHFNKRQDYLRFYKIQYNKIQSLGNKDFVNWYKYYCLCRLLSISSLVLTLHVLIAQKK